MDRLLGISQNNYSLGVREICCRECLNTAFIPGSENIKRLAQLDISSDTVRRIVQQEGQIIQHRQRVGDLGPDFTAADCCEKTVITGMDGVMAPMVTEQQKQKRRETEAKKRKRLQRKSAARACRPRKGSDGPYKEFKLVAFYDKDKSHQYAAGTSGPSDAAGRLLRRSATQIDLADAATKYSVSDGAVWIERQYHKQLPMLDENVLDIYHFKEHLTRAGQVLYGEGTAEAIQWRQTHLETARNHGSLVLLDRLKDCQDGLQQDEHRQEIEGLRRYIAKRIDMTDYPLFIQRGYDIGSGPTESFCGCLTRRLKGPGMRWDQDNAEAVMALGSVYYSNLWDRYWNEMRKNAA